MSEGNLSVDFEPNYAPFFQARKSSGFHVSCIGVNKARTHGKTSGPILTGRRVPLKSSSANTEHNAALKLSHSLLILVPKSGAHLRW